MLNAEEEQPAPGEVPPPGEAGVVPPEGTAPPGGFLAQTAIKEGEAQNRILSQTQYGANAPGG